MNSLSVPSGSMPIKIILASSSPRRSLLLKQLGYSFEILVPKVEELDQSEAGPQYLVEYNSRLKARAVAEQYPEAIKNALIIAADTTVFLHKKESITPFNADEVQQIKLIGRIFNKPKNLEEARNILLQLSGKMHTVFTGVCLKCERWNIEEFHFVASQVVFKSLSEETIRKYHTLVNPLDRAGAYSILEKREMIVEKVKGSLSNVAGLPMEFLQARLRGLFHKFSKSEKTITEEK